MTKVYMLESNFKTRARLMKDIKKLTVNNETVYDASNLKQYYGTFGVLLQDAGVKMNMFFISDGKTSDEGYIPINVEIYINGKWRTIDLTQTEIEGNQIQIILFAEK